MACWWSEYRDWYFNLLTLGTSAPWDTPKGKRRVYTDGDHSFYEKDIAGNFDCVEEQLWAFRHGLSNVVYEIKITRKAALRNLKKLLRDKCIKTIRRESR